MTHVLTGKARPIQGRIGIVVAKYNEHVTGNLLQGALSTLKQHGIDETQITVAWVPGAWEVPVIAKAMTQNRSMRAIIALAAVIRGETTHDQYINQQVSHALGQLSHESGLPVMFGVLTCQSLEQAIQRSGGRVGNKGSECATAALEMVDLLEQLASV